jgi:hypothetical protein
MGRNDMKTRFLTLVLFLGFLVYWQPRARAVQIDEYGILFQSVLNNMTDNYAWQRDEHGNPIIGNWDLDEMYDSTLFAPDILYRLAADPDYGDEAARARVRSLADDTIAYEVDVLLQYILGDDTVMLEAFAGAPCLIDAYRATGDYTFNLIVTLALGIANGIIAEEPNFIGDYMGYVCAHGLLAYYAMYFADVEKAVSGLLAQDIAMDVLATAVARYWDGGEERFWPIYNLYEDAWMLMGLAYAYGATADTEYKYMADAVMAGIDTNLWDDVSGDGGYWEYEDYYYKPSLGPWKKLSTHERIARGMLHWYEVTGDADYLDQARKMLDYTEQHLCTEDLYQPGETVCYHHWTEVSGLPHLISDPEDPGYDPYYENPFCTGCNFNLLIDIYLLNKFVQESEDYPRPIGVCGMLTSGPGVGSGLASLGTVLLILPGVFGLACKRVYRKRGYPI